MKIAFKAKNFVYDGKTSTLRGLVITSLNSGESESSAGSSVKLITDKNMRDSVWYLYGVEYDEQLSFDVEFTSEKPLDRFMLNEINSWLIGQPTYKQLFIEQDDMMGIYYNCIITSATNVFYNNDPHTFRGTVICDAPWAWELPREWTPSNFQSDVFFNCSADNKPMRPIIEITLADNGKSFSIINHSCNDLEMKFENLQGGESLVIDNQRQIITSSTGLFRSDCFNNQFLELKKEINELEFKGNFKRIVFKYQNARKVGV